MASFFRGLSLTTCLVIIVLMNFGLADASRVFHVGDELGWQEPRDNTTAMYGQWAQRNRFRVGDSLAFEYKNDSVIEVDKWGYYHCNASRPIASFNNGNSVFRLDRSGPFYFISGNSNHCRNGQRLVIEVMGSHHHHSPPSIANPPDDSYSAPSPQPNSAVAVSLIHSSVPIVLITAYVAFA